MEGLLSRNGQCITSKRSTPLTMWTCEVQSQLIEYVRIALFQSGRDTMNNLNNTDRISKDKEGRDKIIRTIKEEYKIDLGRLYYTYLRIHMDFAKCIVKIKWGTTTNWRQII